MGSLQNNSYVGAEPRKRHQQTLSKREQASKEAAGFIEEVDHAPLLQASDSHSIESRHSIGPGNTSYAEVFALTSAEVASELGVGLGDFIILVLTRS